MIWLLLVVASACGGAQERASEPATATEEPAETDAGAAQRACFTGTAEMGVCELFDEATEPLSVLSAHCARAGGTWRVDGCPTEGRVGSCAGEGRRAVYYGHGLTSEQLAEACAREGHTFAP
jgi:hypothetical protein